MALVLRKTGAIWHAGFALVDSDPGDLVLNDDQHLAVAICLATEWLTKQQHVHPLAWPLPVVSALEQAVTTLTAEWLMSGDGKE